MGERVLIISPHFYPENFKINDLTIELKKKGYKIDVITSSPHYPSYGSYKNIKFSQRFKDSYKGSSVYRVPVFPRLNGNSLCLAINYLSFVFFGIFLSLFLNIKNEYNKVFIFQVSPVTVISLALISKLFRNSKLYVWILDLWPESVASVKNLDKTFLPNLLKPISNFLYRKCDIFFISSPAFEKNLTERGIEKKKIFFLPQWTEENYFNSLVKLKDIKKFEKFTNITNNKKTFLFAGNIGEAQDIPNILEAVKKLDKPNESCFVFLGEGSKMTLCKKITDDNNLKNVFFLGIVNVSDVKYYIKKSDFMIISLVSKEIFKLYMPAKFQTYLSFGKPIVSSCDGVINDLVSKNNCGISCKSSNSNELSNAFRTLINSNKSKLKTYSYNSLNLYNSQYVRQKVLKYFFEKFEM